MKTLETILTVLIVVALVIGLIPLLMTFGMLKHSTTGVASAGIIVGNLLAYVTVPAILWGIRYFVRKNIKGAQV